MIKPYCSWALGYYQNRVFVDLTDPEHLDMSAHVVPEDFHEFDIFIRNDGTLEEFYDVIDNQLVPFVESFVFDFPEPEEPKEKECLISN